MKAKKIEQIILLGFLFGLFSFSSLTYSQSPFLYGKNKQVYFISSQARDSLQIDSIYTIQQLSEKESGPKGENWSLRLTSFLPKLISDDWAFFKKDSLFKFNFDALTQKPSFLFGKRYDFSSSSQVSYGGWGQGAFPWKDFTRVNDTVVLVAISCVGNCGDKPPAYSKLLFDKQQRLKRSIRYPEKDYSEATIMAKTPQSFIDSLEMEVKKTKLGADTVFFEYDSNGLWLGPSERLKNKNKSEIPWYIDTEDSTKNTTFYQVFIGNQAMEKYIKAHLGYCPKTIIFEIHKNVALVFNYLLSDKKYHRRQDVVLE
ncbi:MAG: hypothetical protein EBZ47_08905 [Chlamydiae bacterium]|nr:hypothetical protein [Chlamydiota bacterium]